MYSAPRSISRPKPYLLTIVWDDSNSATIQLEKLREECPCAMCKGETIMGTTYTFGIKLLKPGMNELESLTPVGNYGLQAKWKDGHDSGIYTWEGLYAITQTHRLGEQELSLLERSE